MRHPVSSIGLTALGLLLLAWCLGEQLARVGWAAVKRLWTDHVACDVPDGIDLDGRMYGFPLDDASAAETEWD